MASLLIVGAPALAGAFAGLIPPSHTRLAYDPDSSSWSGHPGVRPVSGPDEFPEDLGAVIDLSYDRAAKEKTLALLAGSRAAGATLYTNVLAMTATEAASRAGARTAIGISYVPALYPGGTLLEASVALQTAPDDAAAALELLRELAGRELEVVQDRLALVSMRNLAMIINEAAFALMEGVADPGDIDVAMKLGTNYPEGPLAWADRIGGDLVLAVLQGLYDEYQEERYRPCVLLKQYARAGRALRM